MRNFKKNIYPVLFLAVIICMNQILILALKPCTNFRNDIHKLETNQYDDLFVGTSHGKAGINPEVVDKITGERSLNLCLGGEEVQDSYYIIKEACRVNKPKKIIYELDPGYWVSTATLGPEFRTIYDELPLSSVKDPFNVAKYEETDKYFGDTQGAQKLYNSLFKGDFNRYIIGVGSYNYSDTFVDSSRSLDEATDLGHDYDVNLNNVTRAIAILIKEKILLF